MTGLLRREIVSPGGELRAEFVPAAGMVCCSLRAGGRELLDERHGLDSYAQRGATMGIPLLYPWANRLAGFGYEVAGHHVELPEASPLLARDPAGLPIHGVLPDKLRWQLSATTTAAIAATLRWEAPELLELFPFPHLLEYAASVDDRALTIAVTVHAGAASPVPVSFGFHPYLALPPAARARAEVDLPVTERLLLDARMIPTGERAPFAAGRRPLGSRDWDEAFAGLEPPASAAVLDGEERTEVELLEGYRYLQLYSPQDAGFVCIEPMTAPANALGRGQAPLLDPGESLRASFRVRPPRPGSGRS